MVATGAGARLARTRAYLARHGSSDLLPALWRSVNHRVGRTPPRPATVRVDDSTDPIQALEVAGRRTPVISVRLDRLRPYALTVPFTDAERNPFTRTVRDFLEAGIDDYEGSTLERFYLRWTPRTMGAVYGIREARGELAGPPTPDCLPWSPGAWPADVLASQQLHERRMSSRFGTGVASVPHGYRSFGPVSALAGPVFWRDHIDLARSILDHGYQEAWGDRPMMEVLRHGHRWVGRVTAGNHRCAVLAALGHPSVPIGVSRPIVDATDVHKWPGVLSGLYTTSEALQVLDRFVEGAPVPGLPSLD